jgi:hypothetical protein
MSYSRSVCIQCGATNVGIQTHCLLCGTLLPGAVDATARAAELPQPPARLANETGNASPPGALPGEIPFPRVKPPDVPR